MDQPLWQTFLNIAFIAFVARKSGIALALGESGLLAVVDVVEGVVCVFAAFAIWMRRAWVMASLISLGVVFVVDSAIELAHAPRADAAWLAMQMLFGVFATVVLSTLAYRSTPSDARA
jgi:hypothetical protein